MNKEFTCDNCYEEFAILSDSDEMIEYCPFCGELMEIEDLEDFEDC